MPLAPQTNRSSSPDAADNDPALERVLESVVTRILKDGRHSKKRPRKSNPTGEDEDDDDEQEAVPGKDYFAYGRSYARLGQPGFVQIMTIVKHGLKVDARDVGDEHPETEEEKRLTALWKILCEVVPGLRQELDAVKKNRKLREGICRQINTGVEHARSDDSGSLKLDILAYILFDVSLSLNPPINCKERSKTVRGWNHPITAALLTPLEFPANDTTYADVKAGRIKVTAHLFPRFLYPDGREHDDSDMETDLFKGHIMIRAAKHIFMGPSSALCGPGYSKGRPGNAKIIGMQKITPHALAYVAAQVRFAISDVQEWNSGEPDRHFNYEDFFWNLVGIFDDGEGKDILEFYDHQLFGTPLDDSGALADNSNTHRDKALERLKAQRAAKRARQEAASTPA